MQGRIPDPLLAFSAVILLKNKPWACQDVLLVVCFLSSCSALRSGDGQEGPTACRGGLRDTVLVLQTQTTSKRVQLGHRRKPGCSWPLHGSFSCVTAVAPALMGTWPGCAIPCTAEPLCFPPFLSFLGLDVWLAPFPSWG